MAHTVTLTQNRCSESSPLTSTTNMHPLLYVVKSKKCLALISGFHHASLLLVTFINKQTHSINTVVDVKIYVA